MTPARVRRADLYLRQAVSTHSVSCLRRTFVESSGEAATYLICISPNLDFDVVIGHSTNPLQLGHGRGIEHADRGSSVEVCENLSSPLLEQMHVIM